MSTVEDHQLASVLVFTQDKCMQHRYIRDRNLANVVERPERLRAVNVGIAAALARLEDALHAETDEISSALQRVTISEDQLSNLRCGVGFERICNPVDLLTNPSIKFIHGDNQQSTYINNLVRWAEESLNNISRGKSEIPSELPQGDLYLCPESLVAMQHAIGTTHAAVDSIFTTNIKRAFVAIRPPGHHCGADTPSGFCFLNNIMLGIAKAHLEHGLKRAIILDIDLHHGNGTQSLAWSINAANSLEEDSEVSQLQIFYGSLHDIRSYPCEDGNVDRVSAASVSICGDHGQFIENVHLENYTDEDHFWDRLYPEKYRRLFDKAEEFISKTGGSELKDAAVFISAGFDASEHEHSNMSRHGRKVPTSFFHRFTRDARLLADRVASGRLLSVLEGGYSDRALISGTMAHLIGLTDIDETLINKGWWNSENLEKVVKATLASGRSKHSLTRLAWINRATSIFESLDSGSNHYLGNPHSRQGAAVEMKGQSVGIKAGKAGATGADTKKSVISDSPSIKKLPRVILHVRPPGAAPSTG